MCEGIIGIVKPTKEYATVVTGLPRRAVVEPRFNDVICGQWRIDEAKLGRAAALGNEHADERTTCGVADHSRNETERPLRIVHRATRQSRIDARSVKNERAS